MFDKPLDEIGERDLQALVDNQVREDKHLDYKEILDIKQPSGKKEFCADVSSFANTDGGCLIYGMKKSKADVGLSSEVCGLQLDDPGKIETQLGSILQTGLDPRLSVSGIHIQPVELPSNGKWAIIVHIQKSFRFPHMVKDNGKFYVRSATESRPMDTADLRAAFELSGSMADRIHNFRAERLSKIMACEELPALLDENAPKLVLHMIPLSAFSSMISLDVRALNDYNNPSKLEMMKTLVCWDIESDTKRRFNIDGVVHIVHVASWRTPLARAYTQVFRNGSVESVDLSILGAKEDQKSFLGQLFEKRLLQGVRRYTQLQQSLGVDSPVFIMVSLLGVKDYRIERGGDGFSSDTEAFGRTNLILPEIAMDIFDSSSDDQIAKVMRPVFDTVWNAANYSSSPFYDSETGKYKHSF